MAAKKASNKRAKRGAVLSLVKSAALDILLAGVCLVIFAYFHHVRPRAIESENIYVPRLIKSAVNEIARPSSAPEIVENDDARTEKGNAPDGENKTEAVYSPDMEGSGSFKLKFADKFTGGEIIRYEEDGVYHYQSPSLNITITKMRVEAKGNTSVNTSTCYVTDFYISDISCLESAFAGDKFGKGQYEWLDSIAERSGAVAAINGDFASMRNYGVVIRNGMVYRSSHSSFDACALNWDGTMETYYSNEWTSDLLIKNGAYQAWSFGPKLLDKNGQPLSEFNATNAVNKNNPRTAIGYFEPGHYCFVTVDGRSKESRGFTMRALAEFMQSLGCVRAYNLDGGESSSLWYGGEIISKPYDGGRKISDAIYLREYEVNEGAY